MTPPRTRHTAQAKASPLMTAIHWTLIAGDGSNNPPYGHTVAVWIETLNVVAKAYLHATQDGWSIPDSPNTIPRWMVTAWTELPDGPLPPPNTNLNT